MNKLSFTFFLISFLFVTSSFAQNQGCSASELLAPIAEGTMASNTSTPCGFTPPGENFYVNQCSPCGRKISDDNCLQTPCSSLCDLDGFQSTTGAYTEDVEFAPDGSNLAQGFCNGAGTIENNFWVGFTAQTNVVCIEACIGSCTENRGIQVAIVETNCLDFFQTMEGNNPCTFAGVDAGQCQTFEANNLIPGNEYYIMVDGFAGDVCDIQLNVLCGFAEPEFSIQPVQNAILCPDILNPGVFTSQPGSGAIVDVTIGGSSTTDLSFFWCDPGNNLIAETQPTFVNGNFVRGELDGNFFTEIGTYTVKVIDNGSCCSVCEVIPLEVAMPPSAAVAVIAGSGGSTDQLGCDNDVVNLEGNPDDGSTPAVEQWQIVNSTGDRVDFLLPVLVSNSGRINEISITQDDISNFYPGQEFGTATLIYGFLQDLTQLCFGDAAVEITFDFREPNINIVSPEDLSQSNPTVELDASLTNTNGANAFYSWTFQDGTTNGIVSGANTAIATVNQPGVYSLVVTNNGSACSATEQIEVESSNVVGMPSAVILTPQVLNCDNTGQGVALNASNSTGENLTYQWLDSAGNVVGTTAVINVNQPGIYTLFLSNGNGNASAMVEVVSDFLEPQNVTASGGVIDCDNTNGVQLMANSTSTNVSYVWTGDNGIVYTQQNPTVNAAGTYTVVVTDQDNGCTASASVNVTSSVGGPTVIILTPEVLNCSNQATGVDLDAASSLGTGALSFVWTAPNGIVIGTSEIINVTQSGTYTVTVIDDISGCSTSNSVEVFADFAQPQNVTASGGMITCDNTSGIQLMGNSNSPNVSYLWISDGGVQYPNQNPIVISAGVYTLTVTNEGNGCIATATTEVTDDVDVPSVLIEVVNGVLAPIDCFNPSIEFLGVLANPDPNVVLTWFDPSGNALAGNPILVDENSIEGTYTIQALNPVNGCSSESLVTPLFDFTLPDFTLAGGTLFCAPNETVTLSAVDNDPSSTSTFQWAAPNGTSLGPVSNPTVDLPGVYTLLATSNQNGCTAEGAAEVFVNNDTPVVSTASTFTLTCLPGQDNYDLGGSAIAANGMDDLEFVWTLNGVQISTDPNPNVTEGGAYILTVTNTVSNCMATSSVLIGDVRDILILELDITPSQEFMVTVFGGTAPYTYDWNDGTTTELIANPVSGFAYEVTVTDANGCTEIISEIFQSTAIQDTELKNIAVFPNPSSGIFNLSYDTDLQLQEVTVYDIQGREVYAQSNYDQSVFSLLDLSDFIEGAYILEVQFAEGVFRDKILVLR